MPSMICLDNSTKTGAAFWAALDRPPVCWTWKLKKTDRADYGTRGWELFGLLDGFLSVQAAAGTPVDAIGYEEPFLPFSMSTDDFSTQVTTLKLLITLGGVVEIVAKKHGIRCVQVSSQDAKTAMVGFGRRPKDIPAKDWDWKKFMLIAATRAGYRVSNDNEADAVAVGRVVADHCWGVEV